MIHNSREIDFFIKINLFVTITPISVLVASSYNTKAWKNRAPTGREKKSTLREPREKFPVRYKAGLASC
jgi:hypothetical protein